MADKPSYKVARKARGTATMTIEPAPKLRLPIRKCRRRIAKDFRKEVYHRKIMQKVTLQSLIRLRIRVNTRCLRSIRIYQKPRR